MAGKPRLIVFGAGSGFQNLVEHSRGGDLDAYVAAAVTTTPTDSVRERAEKLGVPLVHMAPPYSPQRYRDIVENWRADYVALSGWLMLVRGLDPRRTFNIHPGPLPEFGGKGMYGMKVHEAVHRREYFVERGGVREARRWPYDWTAVSMHFVTDGQYDDGPVFFEYPVHVFGCDTPAVIRDRVRAMEHAWQPHITNLVVHGEISWNGRDTRSLKVPRSHLYLPQR